MECCCAMAPPPSSQPGPSKDQPTPVKQESDSEVLAVRREGERFVVHVQGSRVGEFASEEAALMAVARHVMARHSLDVPLMGPCDEAVRNSCAFVTWP